MILVGELILKPIRLDGRGGVRMLAANPACREITLAGTGERTVRAVATRGWHRFL